MGRSPKHRSPVWPLKESTNAAAHLEGPDLGRMRGDWERGVSRRMRGEFRVDRTLLSAQLSSAQTRKTPSARFSVLPGCSEGGCRMKALEAFDGGRAGMRECGDAGM